MPKTKQEPKEKVCLICIDGWGVSSDENPKGDAIRNAETPVMDKFKETYPYTTIAAHGLAVGLPDGLMGNSEVGHLNIGAGRVVYQVLWPKVFCSSFSLSDLLIFFGDRTSSALIWPSRTVNWVK